MAEKQEKKAQGLVDRLGALIYFEGLKPAQRKEAMPFEQLTEAEQQPYVAQAGKFLQHLDKLNLAAQPKVDHKKEEVSANQEREMLAGIIATFMKGIRTTKPGLFPCEELAARIQEGLKR